MLVLTRKPGEGLLIGGSIRITVLESSKNGRIRLGIEAPTEVEVLREELLMGAGDSSNLGTAERCGRTDRPASRPATGSSPENAPRVAGAESSTPRPPPTWGAFPKLDPVAATWLSDPRAAGRVAFDMLGTGFPVPARSRNETDGMEPGDLASRANNAQSSVLSCRAPMPTGSAGRPLVEEFSAIPKPLPCSPGAVIITPTVEAVNHADRSGLLPFPSPPE
jgi:carbon storage regulator CsrA